MYRALPVTRKSSRLRLILIPGVLAATVAATAIARSAQPQTLVLQKHGDDGKPRETRKFDLSVDGGSAHRLTIDVPIGSLHLSTVRGSRLEVHASRSALLPLSGDGERWLKDSKLTAERQGDTIVVKDIPFGDWPAKRNMQGNISPRFDVQLTIPEGLNVKLKVTAGEVDGGGHFGDFNGSVSAGSLRLDRLACSGALDLDAGAGSVAANLSEPIRRDSQMKAGAGQVSVNLPAGSNLSVTASAGIGNVKGLPAPSRKRGEMELGDRRSAQIGHGGPRLELHAGVGDIKIDSADRATASADMLTHSEDVATSADKEEAGSLDINIPDIEMPDIKISSDDMQKDIPNAKEIQALVAKAMRSADVVSQKAIKDAMKEADRAMKEAFAELKNSTSDIKIEKGDFKMDGKELQKIIDEIVRDAMKTARIAVDEARKSKKISSEEIRRAMEEAMKSLKDIDKEFKSKSKGDGSED